jgi:hypothetical protein
MTAVKYVAFALGMALIFVAPAATYWITGEMQPTWLALIAALAFTILTRLGDWLSFPWAH